MKINEFKKVQEYKELGLSRAKVAEKLKLPLCSVRKVWEINEDEFCRLPTRVRLGYEKYREYILGILKITPQIKETNILFRLQSEFPDFEYTRITFYRYMKRLREETGYDTYKNKDRYRAMRERPQPGYEAQVDFGQFKMIDMYGAYRRLYFFIMVMSYSNLRFCYFSSEPFTTTTAILAHRYAFKFFGGRPQNILYDQDKVFVVNENFGNIMFVKEFEEFVKEIGYTVVLCKPRDPQTKGRVEEAVQLVKMNFLSGRIYYGVDSLNSACLEWLDKYANAKTNPSTGKSARELFVEEAKSLVKVPYILNPRQMFFSVEKLNKIRYDGNFYQLPNGIFDVGDKVEVTESNCILTIKKPNTGEVICAHEIPISKNNNVLLLENERREPVAENYLFTMFSHNISMLKFMENLKAKQPRYYYKSCARLGRLTNYYSNIELTEAAEYCVEASNCCLAELVAYLVYRHGAYRAKPFAYQSLLFNYKERATKIKEELNGNK